MKYGIDISSYQRNIDYNKVIKNIRAKKEKKNAGRKRNRHTKRKTGIIPIMMRNTMSMQKT